MALDITYLVVKLDQDEYSIWQRLASFVGFGDVVRQADYEKEYGRDICFGVEVAETVTSSPHKLVMATVLSFPERMNGRVIPHLAVPFDVKATRFPMFDLGSYLNQALYRKSSPCGRALNNSAYQGAGPLCGQVVHSAALQLPETLDSVSWYVDLPRRVHGRRSELVHGLSVVQWKAGSGEREMEAVKVFDFHRCARAHFGFGGETQAISRGKCDAQKWRDFRKFARMGLNLKKGVERQLMDEVLPPYSVPEEDFGLFCFGDPRPSTNTLVGGIHCNPWAPGSGSPYQIRFSRAFCSTSRDAQGGVENLIDSFLLPSPYRRTDKSRELISDPAVAKAPPVSLSPLNAKQNIRHNVPVSPGKEDKIGKSEESFLPSFLPPLPSPRRRLGKVAWERPVGAVGPKKVKGIKERLTRKRGLFVGDDLWRPRESWKEAEEGLETGPRMTHSNFLEVMRNVAERPLTSGGMDSPLATRASFQLAGRERSPEVSTYEILRDLGKQVEKTAFRLKSKTELEEGGMEVELGGEEEGCEGTCETDFKGGRSKSSSRWDDEGKGMATRTRVKIVKGPLLKPFSPISQPRPVPPPFVPSSHLPSPLGPSEEQRELAAQSILYSMDEYDLQSVCRPGYNQDCIVDASSLFSPQLLSLPTHRETGGPWWASPFLLPLFPLLLLLLFIACGPRSKEGRGKSGQRELAMKAKELSLSRAGSRDSLSS